MTQIRQKAPRLLSLLLSFLIASAQTVPALAASREFAVRSAAAAPELRAPVPALLPGAGFLTPMAVPAAASQLPPAATALPTASVQAANPVPVLPAAAGQAALAAGAEPTAAQALAPVSAEQASLDGAKLFDDAEVRGKTVILVGTRSSRPFILEETVRVAAKLGLKLVLVDRQENREHSRAVVADANFIAAPIDKRDDATIRAITKTIADYAAKNKVDAVVAFRSHHAQLVGRIVDELKVIGVPGKAVRTADDKAKAREKLNEVPELAVASRKVKSAEEARRAFTELGGGKFVMKSNHGENSQFIQMNVDSPEMAEATYRKMEAGLKEFAKQTEATSTIFNRYPGILIERQLEKAPGTHEASVEMVMQNGKAVFAMVSDTHGIGVNEEYAGGSLVFPSQQAPDVQNALIAAAEKATAHIGIKNGNARVDILMTPQGPAIIEVNPYLGGAAIWKAVHVLTGMSLVEYGLRALLGLRLAPASAPNGVVDYRFAAAPANGVIESIEGLDQAEASPGVKHVQLLADKGDRVSAPRGNSFEEWAEIIAHGKTLAEARSRAVAGFRKLVSKIASVMTGDFLQPGGPGGAPAK